VSEEGIHLATYSIEPDAEAVVFDPSFLSLLGLD
jgi:hypothetical protein